VNDEPRPQSRPPSGESKARPISPATFRGGRWAEFQTRRLQPSSLCREHLDGRCTIETIDVEKNFAAALENNILITPALVLITPLPKVVILGNLSDRPRSCSPSGLLDGAS